MSKKSAPAPNPTPPARLSCLPATVTIGGQTYAVKVVSQEDPRLGRDYSGRIMYRDRTIYIDEALSPQAARNVLLHECFHGIMHFCESESDGNEGFVTRTANALDMLLAHNLAFTQLYFSQGHG